MSSHGIVSFSLKACSTHFTSPRAGYTNTFSPSEKQCFNLDNWQWFMVFICQVNLSWERVLKS